MLTTSSCEANEEKTGEATLGIDIFIDAGDAEVGQLDRPIAPYHDVLRLDIPMDKPSCMV